MSECPATYCAKDHQPIIQHHRMSLRDPLELLTYDDLPEELREVAHYCGGMETVVKMLRHLGGSTITIPRLSTLSTLTARYIREEARGGVGGNVKQVAKKLGVSKPYVTERLREGA